MSKNLAVKVCGRLAREAPDMLIALTTKNKAYLCFEAAISVIDCCMTIYSFNSLLREGYVQQEEEMLRANDEYERNTEHIWQTERKKLMLGWRF